MIIDFRNFRVTCNYGVCDNLLGKETIFRVMSMVYFDLQVEDEMLMRKFYELSSALGLNKKVTLPY